MDVGSREEWVGERWVGGVGGRAVGVQVWGGGGERVKCFQTKQIVSTFGRMRVDCGGGRAGGRVCGRAAMGGRWAVKFF